jgi:RimJ/RimL family protein N-acetyltransferase
VSDAWLQLIRDPEAWVAPRPLPAPVETARLLVRAYQRGDGPRLYATIAAERTSILPWMVWAYTDHQSESDSVYFVERVRRTYEDPNCADFPMAILDRRSGAMLGGTGLVRIRRELREAEIGYWVRGSVQRQGIASEAVGALISSALRPVHGGGWGLRRIVVYTSTSNASSRRVCEKLGLRLEMRMKQERYLGAVGMQQPIGYHDVLGYAVLSHEWDFAAHRALPGIAWPASAWSSAE